MSLIQPLDRGVQGSPLDGVECARRVFRSGRHGVIRCVDSANSKVEAVIDATTIQTRDNQRDQHLKSADFFDVEKFPKITFVLEEGGAGWRWANGVSSADLTIPRRYQGSRAGV